MAHPLRTATHMLRTITVLTALTLVRSTEAQVKVEVSSYTFSDGIHPTLSFQYEGTNVKYVESWWQDELKKISGKVSSRKELVGSAALVPQVSADTVRILVKAEQRKGSPHTIAHVAILSTTGWIGPSSGQQAFDGAKDFVQQRSTALRRQLAQQELSSAEKGLSKLQNDLAELQRTKERNTATIEKQGQRGAEAVLEQERSRAELDALAPRIDAARNEQQQAPSEANAKALSELLKEQTRATERNRKANEQESSARKKVDDLTWAQKQNAEEQERVKVAITRQQQLVDDLRAKVAAIH